MHKPERKREYCDHCKQFLTLAVFKRHKADYYDSANRSWRYDTPVYDESPDAEDDDIIKLSMSMYSVKC